MRQRKTAPTQRSTRVFSSARLSARISLELKRLGQATAERVRNAPLGDEHVCGIAGPLYHRRVQKHAITELAGGERVISERVPSVRSVALGFWIGAGSRDEPDARAGVSHFIEHLLFKGSSRYSAQEIAEIFDELGGELNAATSRETTVVFARVPDDRRLP